MHTRSLRLVFYGCWILAAIVQATFTELIDDEAYYWMFSRQLAWGYLDHPPIIALLVKAGYAVIPSAVGVRSLALVCVVVAIYCTEKIVRPERNGLFYLLVLSVAILHFIGFLAIPDAPMLCLTACFLLLYRRFLALPGLRISILLGITGGLLILSKYHGLIVVGLTILSHVRLLRSKYFWLSASVAMGILVPHILWQYFNSFSTFTYHLLERNMISNTIEYLLAQPFVLGPFTGILFFIATLKHRPVDLFERALKWIFWGTYLIFFLLTFKGRVEAHWTIIAVIPGIYFGYHFLERQRQIRTAIYILFPITLLGIVSGRIWLAYDYLPSSDAMSLLRQKHHQNDIWAEGIRATAEEAPVLFMDSYQYAAIYTFYSGEQGYSMTSITGKRSQFDLWNSVSEVRGQRVMVVPDYFVPEIKEIPGIHRYQQYVFFEDFQVYPEIWIRAVTPPEIWTTNDTTYLEIQVDGCDQLLGNADTDVVDVPLTYAWLSTRNRMLPGLPSTQYMLRCESRLPRNTIRVPVITPDSSGIYNLRFGIVTNWLLPTRNSGTYRMEIRD